MKKISDYAPSQDAELIVRLSDVQIKKTTTNADYASMIAFDGKELIEAKIWAFNDDLKSKLKNGEVYRAIGKMKEYQGKMQFNITDITLVDSSEVDISSFYEYAKVEVNELQDYIEKAVASIENKVLQDITVYILKNNYVNFFNYPAAVTMHHNYYSGLAYHTYSMLRLAQGYLELYKFLNKDLVYAGIILHDIGKIVELSGPKGTEYTKEGNLLGHIVIGANEINQAALHFDYQKEDAYLALMHIMLSHHGQLEYGSPKEPMIPEALLIHYLDLNDSKLAALEKEVNKTKPGNYTNPVVTLDRKTFYIPNIEK